MSYIDDIQRNLQVAGMKSEHAFQVSEALGTSHADFARRITAASIEATGETAIYDSPSLGAVQVDADGPMMVRGREVDTGPYERWDSPHISQVRGEASTEIIFGARRLVLDHETATRTGFERE